MGIHEIAPENLLRNIYAEYARLSGSKIESNDRIDERTKKNNRLKSLWIRRLRRE